ncbi:MAG: hypothetical protein CM15mP59_1780 [Flavobacteriaceae bacterium]|nr:MAG: hypothetical protein CM15mP59_1780 [Flavobacteriaceae bacterium]
MFFYKHFFPQIELTNLLNADDTVAMKSGLESDEPWLMLGIWPPMRFLTPIFLP